MACVACHKSKVKCDKIFPCSRCIRRGIVCRPHVSQQGKTIVQTKEGTDRPKKRAAVDSTMVLEHDLVNNSVGIKAPEGTIYHYGLNHMARLWYSLAIRRRSFRLQEMACRLANQVGFSMDQILCGEGLPEDWKQHKQQDLSLHFLQSDVFRLAQEQDVGHTPLTQAEIPAELFLAMRCCAPQQSTGNVLTSALSTLASMCTPASTPASVPQMASRWIWVRETKQGQSRFFTTEAFARDIVSSTVMQQTWIANQQEVKSLFMPFGNNFKLYSQALIHQISLNRSPHQAPHLPTRISGVTIRLASGEIVDVDMVSFYTIPSLDHGFYAQEFIRKKAIEVIQPADAAAAAATAAKVKASLSLERSISHQSQRTTLNVEQLDLDFGDLPEYLGPTDDFENSFWEWLSGEDGTTNGDGDGGGGDDDVVVDKL